MKLTVYFDGQFWVGVAEEADGSGLRASRQVFGAEPADTELLKFVLGPMIPMLEAVSTTVDTVPVPERPHNPKRAAREAAREVRDRGISTQAQQAIKAEIESRKQERHMATREEREQEVERQRELARLKARARHRGH